MIQVSSPFLDSSTDKYQTKHDFELNPIVVADPGPHHNWETKKHPNRWPTASDPPLLLDLLLFSLQPAFAFSCGPRRDGDALSDILAPKSYDTTSYSWKKLQIASPGIQCLQLWNICITLTTYQPYQVWYYQVWNANPERPGRHQWVSDYIHITNPNGITFGEVYDAIVKIMGVWDDENHGIWALWFHDRMVQVQWKICALEDGGRGIT